MTGTEVAVVSDTAALIAAITKASRDPKVDISKMQFLLDTARALRAEQAETEWREAMAEAQSEMGPINKDLENPSTRSRYTSLAALDTAIRPHYSAHGFAITFDTEVSDKPDHLMVVAYAERGRHSRRYQIQMPADGKGAQGRDVMSKTHATGSAVTYGRRYLLCMIFNLVTADDDGARASGYRAPPRTTYPDDPPPERAAHTRAAIANVQQKPSIANAALKAALAPITEAELAELKKLMAAAGVALTGAQVLCQHFEVEKLEDLNHVQFEGARNQLKARAKEVTDGQ